MRELADDSPWKRTDVNDMLQELVERTSMSNEEMAEALNAAYGLSLSRNAIISRLRRTNFVRPAAMQGSRGGPRKSAGRAADKTKPKKTRSRQKEKPVPTFVKKAALPEKTSPVGADHWSGTVNRRGLTLTELDDNTCRWPLGGFLDRPPFLYCGNIVSGGRYCQHHNGLKKKRTT
jgi:hypothetical protein